MKKLNSFRYYVCKEGKKNTHVIQHNKYLKVQIEGKSKKDVLNKLDDFLITLINSRVV